MSIAVGCTNMIPPDNAWLKRSDNDIVIGCYLSQQTWHLKCNGNDWKGLVGTCPESGKLSKARIQINLFETSIFRNARRVTPRTTSLCVIESRFNGGALSLNTSYLGVDDRQRVNRGYRVWFSEISTV